MKQFLLSVMICSMVISAFSQKQSPTAPGNMNPIIPGYFADPTIKKFGDTYYMYATTDGNGGGLGPSQVWTSKDFVNWTFQDMNWPTTYHYWAPDVTLGNDGKYYMYYCQPVEIYGASSNSPVGPWTPLMPGNTPMIPNYFVPGVITLDGQTFRDDDGKFYMYWGTWGIYPDHGCGVGLMNADMKTFAKTSKIPNTIAKDFFEAPFMFKRKGIYYLTYSSGACEDETYRVQYVMSKTGPMDGFTYGKNSPILVTNADKTVHGPGHQSVIQIGEEYYLVYHRHNNPNSGGGFHRQICIDRLVFDEEGNIERLEPTHTGVGLLGKDTNPYPNQAYLKKVTASSFYSDDYKPEFAVDNNNGTLWKPATNSTDPASLSIDLGKTTVVKRVLTEFEYPSWYYQYKIEYSQNGKDWKMYADRTANKVHGSPMIDDGDVTARYIRMTIMGTENPGMYKALWNIKVYSDRADWPVVVPNLNTPAKKENKYAEKGLLIDLDANAFQPGTIISQWKNAGTLGGEFKAGSKLPLVEVIGGKKAVVFNGTQVLESSFEVPVSLSGNSSYAVSFWAYTKQVKDEAPIITWAFGGRDLNNAVIGFGKQQAFGAVQHGGFSDLPYNRRSQPVAGKWQHVVVTFDGTFEKLYVDGQPNNQENKMLFIKTAKTFVLGAKNNRQPLFSGAIASLQVYDHSLTEKEVKALYDRPDASAIAVYLEAAKLPYGAIKSWTNEGAAGGRLTAATTALSEVKDVAGKVAVTFTGKESLALDSLINFGVKGNGSYSVAMSIYKTGSSKSGSLLGWSADKNIQSVTEQQVQENKWQLLIKTFNGKTVKTYIDGVLKQTETKDKAIKTGRFFIGADQQEGTGFTGAIGHVAVYKEALSDAAIQTLQTVWKENLHSPVTGTLSFKRNPKAVTPVMVTMEADRGTATGLLNYYFTRLDRPDSGEWIEQPAYIDYTVAANKQYQYVFKVRDHVGNVTALTAPQTVRTNMDDFVMGKDDFVAQRNFLEQGVAGSWWSGVVGKGNKESAKTITSGDQQLKLESQATNWDGNAPYGPFLYKEVVGDFVAEVTVTDVSGLATKRVTGNNEAGIMVRLPIDTLASGRRPQQQLIQNGIFPAWNVGNLLTNFQNGRREQFNIQTAWNFNKYLQIQRDGDWFFVRTSKDGINWSDMPGTPVQRNDMSGKAVQVGLYQSTYGPAEAYGVFSNFRLIQKK
jgi:hypothetical protein